MRTDIKTVLVGILTLGVLAAGVETARAHDPYGEEIHVYDPYYELHVIHYQLYRRPYHPYYHYGQPIQVLIIQTGPVKTWPREKWTSKRSSSPSERHGIISNRNAAPMRRGLTLIKGK